VSLLDQQDLFGSGPHSVSVGSPVRQFERRSFAGVDGELLLDMGLRGRLLTQAGRLQADTAEDLQQIVTQIEAILDGKLHTLIDNHGLEHAGLLVEDFQLTTPIRRGRRFWCDYTVGYRQVQ